MEEDLAEIWIPQEIWRDILARLPIRCIMRCWSVCKSWRDIIKSDGLLAKQFMAFVRQDKKGYAVADEDGQSLFQFDLPHYSTPAHHRLIIGSVNGLLLVWDGLDDNHDILFVVNPMTCEYIELPPLPTRRCLYGFGVSKLSGQYKVLCVDESRFCYVYTLGGESSWRRIPAPATTRLPAVQEYLTRMQITVRPSLDYAIFFNGNIHWVAGEFEDDFLVCCFDLETELFTTFPLPPATFTIFRYQLCILEDRLCVCDTLYLNYTKIWKMDNYGDPSLWIMEYSFKSPPNVAPVKILHVTPLRVLPNRDLLFFGEDKLSIYPRNTEAYALRGFLLQDVYYNFPSITIFTPSFFSLKTFGLFDVQSLCVQSIRDP